VPYTGMVIRTQHPALHMYHYDNATMSPTRDTTMHVQ